MCLLDACICIQNTHVIIIQYACFGRISMRVLYTHIYACFVRIFTMVNHITLANGFVNIQLHIPLQKDDSHQMLCMRQALVNHILWNCIRDG